MRRRRWWRRALRWAMWIGLGLVGLVIVAVATTIGVLHTDWGRNKVRAEIVAALQADFPGATITALEGSPFGTLVVRGVTLTGRDRQPLATIDTIRIDAALWPLLGKTVRVASLRIDGVTVLVREQPPAAPTPAPPSPAAPSEPSAWTLELPEIVVDRARVVIVDAAGDETIDDVSLTAGLWLRPGAPLAAAVTARGRWRGLPLTALATFEQRDTTSHVPLAAVTLGQARAAAFDVEITSLPTIAGRLAAHVPAELAQQLAGIELPADVELVGDARDSGDIALHARAGAARLDVHATADLAALSARALVALAAPDLQSLTRGEVAGGGTVVVALAADREHVRGIASSETRIADTPPSRAAIAFDASLARIDLVAGARAGALAEVLGGATATATARIEPDGDRWLLADATVVGAARDVADLRGALDARLDARGELWPATALTVEGELHGRRLRRDDARVGRARITLGALVQREQVTTSLDAALTDVRSGTTRIPAVTLDGRATATADGTIAIDLGRHRVRTADRAVWSGRGGRIVVTPAQLAVDRLRTGTGGSRITVSARAGRTSDRLEARVTARAVSLAIADPTLSGEVDAELDISRTRGRWAGTGSARARRVRQHDLPAIDADVELAVAGRRIRVTGHATNPELGRTDVAVEVTGPRDLTDARAWRRLPRSAVDRMTLAIIAINGRALGASGTVDGELVLSATDTRGTLRVRGVETEHGPVDGELVVSDGDGGTIRTQLTAQVAGVPPVTADATFVLPARPFDPVAWQALGRDALREATLRATGFEIDRALLARFGVETPYRARVDATVVADAGARTAKLTASVRDATGAELTAPIDADITATTDAIGTRATITARGGKAVATVDASTPLTVAGALAGGAKVARVAATLKLPKVGARELFGLVGRTEVAGGDVEGTVTLSGTVARPIVRAQLVANRIAIAATHVSRKPPVLDKLEVDARWSGDHAELDVTGHEAGGRLLKISARGEPDDLRTVVASIEAANFDLAPFAAFAPGSLRGARGALTAALTIRGLDPQTGDVRGVLQISDGRMPLSPTLGTLRKLALDVKVVKQNIIATLDGRLGAGSVKGKVTAELEGGMPMRARLDMQLRKISPIGAVQPVIDGDVTGTFVNEGPRWSGTLAIADANVYVPPELGNELLGSGAPADMIFVDATTVPQPKVGRRPPTKPWLVTKVVLGPTDVDVEDQDFRVRVVAKGRLTVEVGDGVGIAGTITTERGAVDVLGRRYRLEHGLIDFDGMPDPRLDIRLVHDFKHLALTVDVRGRASEPDLRLTGDPGTYTQGQLLSFLAGAEPGADDSTTQANQAVVSGGLTFLSSRLGRRINKHLPVKLDTINYEAATTSSSRAVRFGLRVSERSYLLWRQRLEARPDENPGEIVFEYQIRPNALIETTVGERAAGADLLLRTRW